MALQEEAQTSVGVATQACDGRRSQSGSRCKAVVAFVNVCLLALCLFSIDGMVKVRKLKKRMERFNEVVAGLKEGKQEMSQQVQALGAAIDALLVQIKVGPSGQRRSGTSCQRR